MIQYPQISDALIVELENTIGYTFSNKSLLVESLTHPAFKNYGKSTFTNYQKLEFLGDSIINFIITDILLQRFPKFDEGMLSKKRSTLVSKEALYKIAQKLGLYKYIIITPEEIIRGTNTQISVLEDVLEAIVASIYIDSKRKITIVQEFICKNWDEFISSESQDIISDVKGMLQEWSHKKGYGIPRYSVISKSGPQHNPIFEIKLEIEAYKSIVAKSSSKKEAQKLAAKLMLKQIGVAK